MNKNGIVCPNCGKNYSFWFVKPKFKCKKCEQELFTNSKIVSSVLVIITSFILMVLNLYIFYGNILAIAIGFPLVLYIASYIGNKITTIKLNEEKT